MRSVLASLFLLLACAGPAAAEKYVVLVDPGRNDEFLPAAKAHADFHQARLLPFDAGRLDAAFAELKKAAPEFVAFVLPPEKIDVDLVHQILERSTTLDDDPFPDFEYGFITGRDGAAALRFVERIRQAWQHEYGRKVTLFGSWEGAALPREQPLTSLAALKAEGEFHLVRTRDKEDERRQAARKALRACRGKDLLMFFSHGEPDEMVSCFRASDLRDWKIDLGPAVLVNCACYNGAPGRWFAPRRKGVEDRGMVSRDNAVALAVLDSGVVGYFAGVDPWHGPLAMQVFGYVLDDGLRLGAAAKMMASRLALEFLPGRLHFPPTLQNPKRFSGEGTENRRHNGAGMIFYGDPALAPFAHSASRLGFAEWQPGQGRHCAVRLGTKPLLAGAAAEDYMIPQSRLTDYYSLKTDDFRKELSLEIYRVVPLPDGVTRAPTLRVKSAQCGDLDVATRPLQLVAERAGGRSYLHVRVPLDVRVIGSLWPLMISTRGITVELEGELATEP
jgi:hypothetical protein